MALAWSVGVFLVLIVPFMELKRRLLTVSQSVATVLIVPFMELKPSAVEDDKVGRGGLNRTFYGIETHLGEV